MSRFYHINRSSEQNPALADALQAGSNTARTVYQGVLKPAMDLNKLVGAAKDTVAAAANVGKNVIAPTADALIAKIPTVKAPSFLSAVTETVVGNMPSTSGMMSLGKGAATWVGEHPVAVEVAKGLYRASVLDTAGNLLVKGTMNMVRATSDWGRSHTSDGGFEGGVANAAQYIAPPAIDTNSAASDGSGLADTKTNLIRIATGQKPIDYTADFGKSESGRGDGSLVKEAYNAFIDYVAPPAARNKYEVLSRNLPDAADGKDGFNALKGEHARAATDSNPSKIKTDPNPNQGTDATAKADTINPVQVATLTPPAKPHFAPGRSC